MPVALFALLTALLVVLAGCTSPTANTADPTGPVEAPKIEPRLAQGSNGLTVTAITQVNEQTFDVRLKTDAIDPATTNKGLGVRIQLPKGYQPSGSYPLLMLLHGSGGGDDYTTWSQKADLASTMGPWPYVVVTPDGGKAGWYNDWSASPMPQKWQTFHLTQLLAWVNATLAVSHDRADRVIGGASAGGYGAIRYAQAAPEQFGYAVSLSGLLDLRPEKVRELLQSESEDVTGDPSALFGSGGKTSGAQWDDADVRTNVAKLTDVNVQLFAGSGSGGDDIETQLQETSKSFAELLAGAGVNYRYTNYGNPGSGCDGGHHFGCWSQALVVALTQISVVRPTTAATVPPQLNPKMTTPTQTSGS